MNTINLIENPQEWCDTNAKIDRLLLETAKAGVGVASTIPGISGSPIPTSKIDVIFTGVTPVIYDVGN